MKTASLLLATTLGIGAGVLIGWRQPAPLMSLPTQTRQFEQNSGAALGRLDPASAFSNDPRMIRLFSAALEPVNLLRRFELAEALRDLTAQDLPALIKHVDGLPQSMRDELLSILMNRWLELDSKAAAAWARAHPRFARFDEIEALVRADPEAAIRDALAAPRSNRSVEMLDQAIFQLAGDDYRARIAKLKTFPASELRSQVLQHMLYWWAETEPAAAYAALGELAAGPAREKARAGILRSWATSDPAGALREMSAVIPTLEAGVLGSDLVTRVAELAGKKDRRLVLDWLGGLPVEFRMAPAIAAAADWAKTEPTAALDWCLENGVDVARGRRVGLGSWSAGVLGEALAADPSKVLSWLGALPAGANHDTLMERALWDSLWRVPNEQRFEKEAVSMRLFGQLSEEAQLNSASEFGKARGKMESFTDLNAWAQTFSPGPVRADAVAGAVASSFERGAAGADALIDSVSPGPDRDAALRGLVNAMSSTAPANAASRALGIGDSNLRRETLGAVVSGWLKDDPEASRAWLAKDALIPAVWKETWLNVK